jgi:hypothetical protein
MSNNWGLKCQYHAHACANACFDKCHALEDVTCALALGCCAKRKDMLLLKAVKHSAYGCFSASRFEITQSREPVAAMVDESLLFLLNL